MAASEGALASAPKQGPPRRFISDSFSLKLLDEFHVRLTEDDSWRVAFSHEIAFFP